MTAIAIILAIVVLLAIAVYLVLRLYPAFGARAFGSRLKTMDQSAHYAKGQFRNLIPTSMSQSPGEMLHVVIEMIKGSPNRRPRTGFATESVLSGQLADQSQPRVFWFGHSSLLLQLNGLTLLLDPMFGQAPSPFPAIGGKRYSRRAPLDLDQLPQVDAVLLSHDHYDHLDYGSIKQLHAKVGRFFVPLGVGAHLERWGVPREKITEADWWDETGFAGLKLACTPSRHFSGRSLNDRNATLWCSWVIDGGGVKIYFSGDSGYGPHFQEIGSKYGPFDLTLMECGQYDKRWAAIHMMPEETVQAHQDVQGKLLLPIHWGAFTLSVHSWTDPVERALAAAERLHVPVATPRIGQPVIIGADAYPAVRWWREL